MYVFFNQDTFKQTRAVAQEAARKAEETLEGAAPVGEEYAPVCLSIRMP